MFMINELTNALATVITGIIQDFTKIFNTVNHNILLDKVYHNGIVENDSGVT